MKIVLSLILLAVSARSAVVFPAGSYVALEQPVFRTAADFGTGYGQTFTLTDDISIIGVELLTWGLSGGMAFTLEVHHYDASSVSVDANILGSGRVALGEISLTDLAWTPIILDRAVEGMAGGMFAFTHRHEPNGKGYNVYGNSRLDPYAGGTSFGGYRFIESGFDPVVPQVGDYSFRIIAIPESQTALFFTLGMGCLLGKRRRSEAR